MEPLSLRLTETEWPGGYTTLSFYCLNCGCPLWGERLETEELLCPVCTTHYTLEYTSLEVTGAVYLVPKETVQPHLKHLPFFTT